MFNACLRAGTHRQAEVHLEEIPSGESADTPARRFLSASAGQAGSLEGGGY